MSTTLSISKMGGAIVWDYENVLAWGNAPSQSQFSYTGGKFSLGTGANQADTLYVAQITLAGAGTTTLTLSSLLDMFKNSIAFARVKGIYIDSSATLSTAPATLSIGGATLHPALVGTVFDDATATIRINSGGNFVIVAPDATAYPVVSGTSDQLLFTNLHATNSLSFNLVIVGASV